MFKIFFDVFFGEVAQKLVQSKRTSYVNTFLLVVVAFITYQDHQEINDLKDEVGVMQIRIYDKLGIDTTNPIKKRQESPSSLNGDAVLSEREVTSNRK